MSEGATKAWILCGVMEGVAQHNQSHISKITSRWTALWVRCGWWQTRSQWDSWHSLTSMPSCIMSSVQMRSSLVGIRPLWPVWIKLPHLIHSSTWLFDVVLLMITGSCVYSCAESFFQSSLNKIAKVYFLTPLWCSRVAVCSRPFEFIAW